MKQIDSYISEKLHINKNYKNYSFEAGDTFGVISIYEGTSMTSLLITQPMEVVYMGDDGLRYKPYKSKRDENQYFKGIKVNSNGYYEYEEANIIYVCLTKKDMLNFLYEYETLHKYTKKLFKYIYDKFIDKRHAFPTNDLNLNKYQKSLDELIKAYKSK